MKTVLAEKLELAELPEPELLEYPTCPRRGPFTRRERKEIFETKKKRGHFFLDRHFGSEVCEYVRDFLAPCQFPSLFHDLFLF